MRETWDVLKSSKVKVCPICGHIAGVSCFYDNAICCICGSDYVDSDVSCYKYFSRDEYSIPFFGTLQEKVRKSACKNPFDLAMSEKRIGIENDRLPERIELQTIPDMLPNYGVIPALVNTLSSIRTSNSRVWQIYLNFQTYISHYL